MVTDARKILNDINDKISKRDIFKYNREVLVRLLITASMRKQYISYLETFDTNYVDQCVEQFRTILKFIFMVDNENGDIPEEESNVVSEFSKMIDEFVNKYTPVRNYLEQCELETRKIRFDEYEEKFVEDDYDDYSNYSRMIDRVKKFPSSDIKEKCISSMGKYLERIKFKTDIFKDRFFMSLMDDYIEICRLDSEIKFEYDFGDFTYSELLSFCAALKIIADFYTYMMIRKDCLPIPNDTLVNGISKLTGLNKEKVQRFIDYQTYDYSYQKNKLTLIQGLIKINGKFYFYPITINLGLLPLKMYRLITYYGKEKYRIQIAKISKEKERQMTDEIKEKLQKYDLLIETNYKKQSQMKTLAEYDMLVFDKKSKNLYIMEFKWFFVGDGEKEHKILDNKLADAVEHRFEKDKYIMENPQKVCDELFNKEKVQNVYELLISQNFGGNIKHEMTVIDFETLQWSIEEHESFSDLINFFLTDEYRKSIPVESRIVETEIEGYKFSYYRMFVKKE